MFLEKDFLSFFTLTAGAWSRKINPSSNKRSGPLPFAKSYVIKKAKITLYPRRDHLIRQAGRLGIKFRQYTTDELIDLYYSVYNPEHPAVKKEPEVILEHK